MMKGKWYVQDEPNILEPWSGWDEGQSPLSKCIWYYRTVNEHIYKYKRWVKLVYFTEDLPEWENKYPADITYKFTEEELTRIHDGCDSSYKKAMEYNYDTPTSSVQQERHLFAVLRRWR